MEIATILMLEPLIRCKKKRVLYKIVKTKQKLKQMIL